MLAIGAKQKKAPPRKFKLDTLLERAVSKHRAPFFLEGRFGVPAFVLHCLCRTAGERPTSVNAKQRTTQAKSKKGTPSDVQKSTLSYPHATTLNGSKHF